MLSLGLYIHWPFCVTKCPYCDFNSHVRKDINEQEWQKALLTELRWLHQNLGEDRFLETIYFGGGTPSLMLGSLTYALIEEAKKLWKTDENLEITLEANPGTYDSARFSSYAQAGVKRLSLGVQSLRDERLRYLGRIHGATEAREALIFCSTLFSRVSFDLIYGLPIDTLASWEVELEEALTLAQELGVEHCSLYQLVLEKGTLFYSKHQRGEMAMLDGDQQSDFFGQTNKMARRYGMSPYEVSNYARDGAICCYSQHNLRTWRYDDYAGIGPGAHSRVRVGAEMFERKNLRLPEKWLSSVASTGRGLEDEVALDKSVQMEESLMMGLRLYGGVNKVRFLEKFGVALENILDRSAVEMLKEGGDLEEDEHALRASLQGMGRLDSVVLRLVSSMSVF